MVREQTRMERRRGVRAAAAACAAALLAGACSSAEDWSEQAASRTPAAPAVWTAAPEGLSGLGSGEAAWLQTFGDPALEALIAAAFANNPSLADAAARLDAAGASLKAARAGLLPSLDLDLSARRDAVALETPAGFDRLYDNSYALGLSTRWEADIWGRVRDGAGAAGADFAASEADFQGARLSVAGAVARAWFGLSEARLQRELAESDLERSRLVDELVERRYGRGLATSRDVRLARSNLASSEATLAQRAQVEGESARALQVLVGAYPDAGVSAPGALPQPPALTGVVAPAEMLTARPDMRAAEARLAAAGLRVDEARKALLPGLTLTGRTGTGAPDAGDLLDPDRLAGNVAGGLLAPIFRGGALRANADRQRALADAALASYVQTALSAYQEVEDALAAEQLLADRGAALQVAFEEASAAEALTLREYGQGLGTIFELLDARQRTLSSASQVIANDRARLANRVALHLALGGQVMPEPEGERP